MSGRTEWLPSPWAKKALAAAGVLAQALVITGCADDQAPSRDLATASPSAPSPSAADSLRIPPDAVLLLELDDEQVLEPVQRGTGDVDATVSALEEGRLTSGEGPNGSSFRFPRFVMKGAYPRAVVVAGDRGGGDSLDPGKGDFTFGADFRLDALSRGRPEDDGNNVLQRGLSSDRAMFKLEVDVNLRPGCMVKGDAGQVSVISLETVEPDRWYRARCERRGDRLLILVSEYLPSGSVTTTGRESAGQIGSVSPAGPDVPLSVGGKVARDGTVIASATDQFNGQIASPFLAIPGG